MWMKLMLGMIGGYFGDLIESICGAVCSSRQKGSKVYDVLFCLYAFLDQFVGYRNE
jgi:hypothetical protein